MKNTVTPFKKKGFLAKHPGKQEGASLVEIVAYLGVAGLVIGGALAMFSGASASQSVNQMMADTGGVRTSIKSLWSQSADFGDKNMLATLKQSSRLPATWVTKLAGDAMTATHQLNGGVGVIGKNGTFAITYDAIPPDVCTAVVSQQGSQGWVNVYVADAAGNITALTGGEIDDFTPTEVSSKCASTTTSPNKKITLESR